MKVPRLRCKIWLKENANKITEKKGKRKKKLTVKKADKQLSLDYPMGGYDRAFAEMRQKIKKATGGQSDYGIIIWNEGGI